MKVTTGDVINALTMNGKARFSNMQKLLFPQSGRIIAVYKKVGDFVKMGEVIARMDAYEVDNELEQIKIGLDNEQRNLIKAQDTSKKELEIMQAEKKYQALLYEKQTADTSLKLALQTIENEYVNKKNGYTKLLSDYEKKQKEYNTKKKTYDEIIVLDKSNQILYADEILKTRVEDLKFTADGIKKELDTLDKVMLYTPKYGNVSTTKPAYYIYIGAKDQLTKKEVERLFYEISSVATEVYNWANNNSGAVINLPEVTLKSQLIQQYEKLKRLADKKTELHLAIVKMLDASIESEGVTMPTISVSDGRALKETANKNMDEIL
jgi:multidrug efflux pump subunit AcrA (membrane-fusion protein)